MMNSPYGDWEKSLTKEEQKMAKEILDVLKSGDKDKFKEVVADNLVKMRDDFTKEEVMEILNKNFKPDSE